jgi:hypothetical protein
MRQFSTTSFAEFLRLYISDSKLTIYWLWIVPIGKQQTAVRLILRDAFKQIMEPKGFAEMLQHSPGYTFCGARPEWPRSAETA